MLTLPILDLTVVSTYTCTLSRSGAFEGSFDFEVWRPTKPPKGYILADYCQPQNWNLPPPGTPPTEQSVVVLDVINDDPVNPVLKAPENYVALWTCQVGNQIRGVFMPVAPIGYVACGAVGLSFTDKIPDKITVDGFMCVRVDYTETVDRNTGLSMLTSQNYDCGPLTTWQVNRMRTFTAAQLRSPAPLVSVPRNAP
ncbi:MAG: Vps62-related protein [bacterium]|nr:Vps62-related protein [bacterium]